jgi:hypothetical protein
MAIASHSQPELEFLTTTHPSSQANDEESRRIVRSHAIRDANRRKKLGLEPGKSHGSVMTTSPSQSQLTTKFRLHTKTLNRAAKLKAEPMREERGTEVLPSIHAKFGSNTFKGLMKYGKSPQGKPAGAEHGRKIPTSANPPWKEAIPVVLGAGDYDPFDTLSIKLGPKQQALMHYRMYANLSHPVFKD